MQHLSPCHLEYPSKNTVSVPGPCSMVQEQGGAELMAIQVLISHKMARGGL